MAGHRNRRGSVQVEALPRQRANRGHLGEQNAGAGDRGGDQLRGGGQRLFGGQRPDPLQRLEADRPHDDELARNGLENQRRLTDDLTQLGFDARRADQLLQVLQPGAALAAERDRIRLSGVQPIDEGVCRGKSSCVLDGLVLAAGGHPALFVDRHVVLSPSVLSRAVRLARIARRLWLSYLELLMACAPLRRPCDSASNPDWFRRVRHTGHPTVL